MGVILIGMGGMGVGTVRRVKRKIRENPKTAEWINRSVFFLGIDVEEGYDAKVADIDMLDEFCVEDPWALIDARATDEEFLKWWIRGFNPTSPIKGKLGAGQIRLCGRLVFYKLAHRLKDFLDKTVKIAREASRSSALETTLHVFLVTSLGGGTGSGIFLDVAFLLRDILEVKDELYGVLFDGTTTEQFATGTGPYGFGALVELERWMTKAKTFSMKYEDLSLDRPKVRLDNIFRIVFLFQGRNMDGRAFIGKYQQLADDYKDIAAEFLYTYLSAEDFTSEVEANRWNRFDNLPDYNSRSLRYSGVGISYISFPWKKVSEYCYAKYCEEYLAKGFELDPPVPDVETFKHSLQIAESDGKQLTHYLHSQSKVYKLLEERKVSALQRLEEKARKPSQFNEIYDDTELGRVEISRLWSQGFLEYKEEIEQKLKEMLELAKMEILRLIGGKEVGKGWINSLSFQKIQNWLMGLRGAIAKEVEYIDRYKKRDAEEVGKRRKELKEKAASVSEAKKISVWGVSFSAAKDDFLSCVQKWFLSEISNIEYYKIRAFYLELQDVVDIMRNSVSFLEERFRALVSRHSQTVGYYTSRKWLLDPTRFEQGEYVLDLKVGVSREVIEKKIYEDIKEEISKSKGDIVNIFSTGVIDEKAGVRIKGIPELFDEIYHVYTEGERTKISSLQGRRGDYSNELENLFKFSLYERIERIVKRVKIDEALEWWLKENYKDVKEAKASGDFDELERQRARLEYLLGSEAGKALIEADDLPEDKWVILGVEALFKKMRSLTKPFIQIDGEKLGKIWEETGVSRDANTKDALMTERIYVPTNFRFREKIKFDLQTIKEDHRIIFYKQLGGFPLLVLTSLKDFYQSYFRNGEEIRRAIRENKRLPAIPCHADMRFLYEWRDNILEERPVEEEIKRLVHLLLGFGFGLGVIKRGEKKAFYLVLESEEMRLANHLPKLIGKLGSDWSLRKEVQRIIYTKVENIWYPKKDVEEILSIFYRAYTIIKTFKPPQRGTKEIERAYGQWKQLLEDIKCVKGESSFFPEGALVPKSKGEVEQVIEYLRG